MEKIINMPKKINIEKVLDYNYFLILTSFIFFIDTYCIYFLECNIRSINIKVIQQDIGSFFVILFLYFFIMTIVSKVANHTINFIYSYKLKYTKEIDRTDYMFSDDILNLSILNNNSVLYNYYKKHQKDIELIYKRQYLSTAVMIILICNFLVSSEVNTSLIRILELFINSNEWYYIFIHIVPIGTIVYIAYSIFDTEELYYIYLPKNIQNSLLKDLDETI